MSIRRLLVATTVSCLLCLSSAPASAQNEKDETIRVTSRLVNVEVLVTDKRTGARVDDLSAENFEILDNGRPVTIKHFSRGSDPEKPLFLVLLVNVRRTTRAIVPRLQTALAEALKNLRPEDQVAVIEYFYGHEIIQSLTRDRQQVLAAFETAVRHQEEHPRPRPKWYSPGQSGVGQDLADALIAAVKHARESNPRARLALVAIDDDLNATKRTLLDETAEKLIASGATVNGLVKVSGKFATTFKALGRVIDAGNLSPREGENVVYYSARTGGEVVNIKDDEFGDALERVVGNIVARYSIGFVPDPSRLDGRLHKLKVNVKIPAELRKGRKVEIRARQGYLALRDETAGRSGEH